jgi:hypothetical protein
MQQIKAFSIISLFVWENKRHLYLSIPIVSVARFFFLSRKWRLIFLDGRGSKQIRKNVPVSSSQNSVSSSPCSVLGFESGWVMVIFSLFLICPYFLETWLILDNGQKDLPKEKIKILYRYHEVNLVFFFLPLFLLANKKLSPNWSFLFFLFGGVMCGYLWQGFSNAVKKGITFNELMLKWLSDILYHVNLYQFFGIFRLDLARHAAFWLFVNKPVHKSIPHFNTWSVSFVFSSMYYFHLDFFFSF